MVSEKKEKRDMEINRFKTMLVAMNPEMASIFDEDGAEPLAEPLSDAEMENAGPLTVEDMEELSRIIRAVGGAIV